LKAGTQIQARTQTQVGLLTRDFNDLFIRIMLRQTQAKVHPDGTGSAHAENIGDVIANLMLASVNSSSFSKTSVLGHSSNKMTRRRSLDLINSDPIWSSGSTESERTNEEENDGQSSQDLTVKTTMHAEACGSPTTVLANTSPNTARRIAKNASPTKNDRFIKTLDSISLSRNRHPQMEINEGTEADAEEEEETQNRSSEDLRSARSSSNYEETSKSKEESVDIIVESNLESLVESEVGDANITRASTVSERKNEQDATSRNTLTTQSVKSKDELISTSLDDGIAVGEISRTILDSDELRKEDIRKDKDAG